MERRTISKIQVKTKNRNVIPLSDKAASILNNWRMRYPDNCFVFGLIPNDFNLDDSEQLYRIRNTKTRGINQAFLVVGRSLNLPFELTFHCKRHRIFPFSLRTNDLQNLNLRQVTIKKQARFPYLSYSALLKRTLNSKCKGNTLLYYMMDRIRFFCRIIHLMKLQKMRQ